MAQTIEYVSLFAACYGLLSLAIGAFVATVNIWSSWRDIHTVMRSAEKRFMEETLRRRRDLDSALRTIGIMRFLGYFLSRILLPFVWLGGTFTVAFQWPFMLRDKLRKS